MKRLLKIIFVLILLFVLAVSGFIYMFDANKYKQELAELAQSYTGRSIALEGDIKLSLYPWTGVQLQNVTIGNKPGFSKKDFASIERFDIRVKILPLFQKRLEIEELVVHRLAADFELNTVGENNWSDLIGESKKSDSESGLNGLLIGGIEVTDSRLSWLDVSMGKRFNLSSLNIATEAYVEGQSLPMTLKAYIESNQPEWKASTSVKAKLAFTPGSPIFDANDLELAVKAILPIKNMDPVTFALVADSRVNVRNKTIRLDDASFRLLDLVVSGTFDIENIFSIPTIQGPLKIKKFEASTLAQKFKVDLPELAGEKSLRDISLTAKFKTDFESIYLDNLNAKVDSSKLSGFIRLTKLTEAMPVVRYDLDIDNIVLDDYLLVNSDEFSLPVAFARSVDLEGKLEVDSFVINEVSISSLHAPAKINQGVLTFNPIAMDIGDAKVRAAMEIRALSVPVTRATIKVNNLNVSESINPLLARVMGGGPITMQGVATVTSSLKSTGNNIKSHKGTLKGTIGLNMQQFVIQGLDLKHTSKQVVSDYANKNEFITRKSYVPDFDPNSKYDFKSLRITFDVSGNKITTNDMLLVSDVANISGRGSIDFQKHILNSRMVVDTHVKDRIDIRNKLLDHPMEYDVLGPFGNLTTQFDVDRYELRVGRLLMIEAKARKIRAIKNKGNNTW